MEVLGCPGQQQEPSVRALDDGRLTSAVLPTQPLVRRADFMLGGGLQQGGLPAFPVVVGVKHAGLESAVRCGRLRGHDPALAAAQRTRLTDVRTGQVAHLTPGEVGIIRMLGPHRVRALTGHAVEGPEAQVRDRRQHGGHVPAGIGALHGGTQRAVIRNLVLLPRKPRVPGCQVNPAPPIRRAGALDGAIAADFTIRERAQVAPGIGRRHGDDPGRPNTAQGLLVLRKEALFKCFQKRIHVFFSPLDSSFGAEPPSRRYAVGVM